MRVSGCSSCSGLHITGEGDLEASGCSHLRATCVDKKRVSKEASGLATLSLSTAGGKPEVATEVSEDSDEIVVVAPKKRKTEGK